MQTKAIEILLTFMLYFVELSLLFIAITMAVKYLNTRFNNILKIGIRIRQGGRRAAAAIQKKIPPTVRWEVFLAYKIQLTPSRRAAERSDGPA